MPNWNVTQSRFTQGELSPYLVGQESDEAVAQGSQLIQNGVVLPQGPVTKRPGTLFLDTIDDIVNTAYVRLWRFIGPDNADYFILLYDDKLKVYDWQNGVIGGTTGGYSIVFTDTFTTALSPPWQSIIRSDSASGYMNARLINETHQVVYLNDGDKVILSLNTFRTTQPPVGYQPQIQEIKRSDVLPVETFDVVCVINARWVSWAWNGGNPAARIFPGWLGRLRVSIGTTLDGTEITQETVTLLQLVDQQYSISATLGVALPAGTTIYTRIEYILTLDDPSNYPLENTYAAFDAQIDDVRLQVRPETAASDIEFITPYVNDEIDHLHFLQSPYGNKELLFLHPDHPPKALSYDGLLDTWDFIDYVFIDAPGSWGVDNKWPSIGAGAEGRLFLSGLDTDPERIWASQSGSWDIFTAGTNPNDSIDVAAIKRDINTWIMANKSVIFGDRLKESIFNPGGTPVAPNDIQLAVQTSFGSERMPQKISMGKNVVLATGGNSDLRLSHYNRNDGGFIAPNIILKAEHLGRKGFKRHFYTRDPHQMLWNIMTDGTIIVCSFDDEYQTQAWSRIVVDGRIIDGCSVVDDNGRDVVILAVQRNIGSGTQISLETIPNLSDESRWLTTDMTVEVTTDTFFDGATPGFDVLEGQLVAVYIAGRFDGFQVVTNGEVNARDVVNNVRCGLAYNFICRSFPQAQVYRSEGMTARKVLSKVGIRGYLSLPPLINGVRPPDRSPQGAMGVPEPSVELIDTELVDAEYNNLGVIDIQEPLPVRITILATYAKLTSNQL